jgi:hypothetical protein
MEEHFTLERYYQDFLQHAFGGWSGITVCCIFCVALGLVFAWKMEGYFHDYITLQYNALQYALPAYGSFGECSRDGYSRSMRNEIEDLNETVLLSAIAVIECL